MNEEEKKAIEKLSSNKNETTWYDTIRHIKREEIQDTVVTRQQYITTILNLIEKQQKELEKKDKIIDKLLMEITAVNSGRYEYMENDRVLEIFTNLVEKEDK